MPDDRPLSVKLRAMAEQDASPQEAAIARRILSKLGSSVPPSKLSPAARTDESPRVLGREAILGSPDRTRQHGTVQVRINGLWVTLDKDEATLVRSLDLGSMGF